MNDGMIPQRITPDYPHWLAVLRLILDAFAFMEIRIDPPSSAHRLTVADMAAQAQIGAVWVIEHNAALSPACSPSPRAAPPLYILARLLWLAAIAGGACCAT